MWVTAIVLFFCYNETLLMKHKNVWVTPNQVFSCKAELLLILFRIYFNYLNFELNAIFFVMMYTEMSLLLEVRKNSKIKTM